MKSKASENGEGGFESKNDRDWIRKGKKKKENNSDDVQCSVDGMRLAREMGENSRRSMYGSVKVSWQKPNDYQYKLLLHPHNVASHKKGDVEFF